MQSSQSSGGERFGTGGGRHTNSYPVAGGCAATGRQLEVISPPARSRDLVEAVKLHRVMWWC